MVADYYDVIFHPMDMSLLEKKVRLFSYGSTEGFVEDVRWIAHNSVIFNGVSSKYSHDAKLVLKICRHEVISAFIDDRIKNLLVILDE